MIFWSRTLDDIKFKVKNRIEYEQARNWQEFQIMAELLSRAFGGGSKESGGSPPPAHAVQPRNAAEASAILKGMFR